MGLIPMFEHNGSGNGKPIKINLYDDEWFPKISHLTGTLTDTDKNVIEALVGKDPSETWEDVARRVGITSRQLYNIRQKKEVQEACYVLSKELFKSDLPDVLKVLTRKAKVGEGWAVKLFLELVGELRSDRGGSCVDDDFRFGIPETKSDDFPPLRV
jgi:hypothetical protein